MEQKNNKQDRIIFEIENLLNKMSNQVNFLIRKEMTMNQLDVDLLMENTRKLYDTICSIELGIDSDTDFDSEFISPDFDVDSDSNTDFEPNTESDIESDSDFDSNSDIEYDTKLIGSDTILDFVPEDEPVSYHIPEKEADMVWDLTKENEELSIDTDEDSDEDFDSDIDNETDEDSGSDIDNETDEDSDDTTITEKEDSGIRTYKIVRENVHTLGDVLEKAEDNSLAARLQRKPVSDLISAIGINDRFLFLNELFGGSMEKYNKSIRSLNSFSTLLGAKTYMSELQIEFQWDCNSDAYKKLADLVERRFI